MKIGVPKQCSFLFFRLFIIILLFHLCSCMLSPFGHVRLSVIPWTAVRQAPVSMGFSRQGSWSGLPFPSPFHLYSFSYIHVCVYTHIYIHTHIYMHTYRRLNNIFDSFENTFYFYLLFFTCFQDGGCSPKYGKHSGQL